MALCLQGKIEPIIQVEQSRLQGCVVENIMGLVDLADALDKWR